MVENPFRTISIDRSMPPVLVQLRDLSEFHAAQGQFEVTVDHEDDVALLPSFVAGERVQYAAAAEASNVRDRARENVRAMLGTLLASLGFEHVEVQFGR